MITTEDPRLRRQTEDWTAYDPGQHPPPPDLLGTPLPFRAWLRRTPQRRFWRPTDPLYCPLASFVRQESGMGWVHVDSLRLTWEPPLDWGPLQAGKHHMALPGWAQRFVIIWDLWCTARLVPWRPSTREARAIAWLCTASPRRMLHGLRHGLEAIP